MDGSNGADDAIRVSITLPGSASLGAFQAGAASALAEAIYSLRRQGVAVHLDAVGGSSAGSIVAVLFTHSLLTGRDGPGLLRRAWIEEVDMDLLRNIGADSPLSFDDLRVAIADFIADEDEHPPGRYESIPGPTILQVGLTSLLGFESDVDGAGSEMSALSYSDWAEFTLEADHGPDALLEGEPISIVEAVLASASHPLGFPPVTLDRSDVFEVYRAKGITNLPDDPRLWYTDGGLVESKPIGSVIEAARRCADGGGRRMHLVIDPRSSGPSREWDIAGEGAEKSWLEGVRRAISVVPTQALHDDLRMVAGSNRRLIELDELADALAAETGLDRDDLRRRVAEVAGLEDKEPVAVEMISPLLLAGTSFGSEPKGSEPKSSEPKGSNQDETEATDLLAGDFIGAFGGFLNSSIREADFTLGWFCTLEWLPGALQRMDLPPPVVEETVRAVRERADEEGLDPAKHGGGTSNLNWKGRLRLTLLAGQFGRVLVSKALPFNLPHPHELRAAVRWRR